MAHAAIITIAALARLHFRYGWPSELLGTQSVDYAFDPVAYREGSTSEHIACEAKKSDKEVSDMLRKMQMFSAKEFAGAEEATIKQADRNAFRRMCGLRRRQAPIFWAVGPAGTSRAFAVAYRDDQSVVLAEKTESLLAYVEQG